MSLAKPKSAIFMTLFSVTKTFLAAKSRWMHWKQKKKEKKQPTEINCCKSGSASTPELNLLYRF